MKAAVWYGKKEIRIEEVADPVAEPGKVVLKVKACGICGSDLHEYTSGPIIIPTEKPDPLTGQIAPIILGHEFSGEIVDLGSNVKGWQIGDRVTVDPAVACWNCPLCKRFQYNQCAKLACTGLSENGAFAEFVSVRDYQLNRLNDEVSWIEGAVVEPLAVGVHAVVRSSLALGENVVILGSGTIGLAVLQAAKAAGAANVYMVGGSEKRRELALKLGASKVFPANSNDALQEIKELTGGSGPDVCFECVGKEETVNQCLALTRSGGRIVIVGVFRDKSLIDCNEFSLQEKDIIGCRAYAGDFKTVISLLSNAKMQADMLVTKEIELKDIVEEGFKTLLGKQKDQVKIIVSF